MPRVIRERTEAVSLIERPGSIVDRIDCDGVDAELIGQAETAVQGIEDEPLA